MEKTDNTNNRQSDSAIYEKLNLADKAKEHYEYIERAYPIFLDNSVVNAEIYTDRVPLTEDEIMKRNREPIEFLLTSKDTVSALFDFYSLSSVKKPGILNFASYRTPGGGFLQGYMAQEESLCHESTLYNCLIRFDEYYEWNKRHISNGLYRNRALYNPDVLFIQRPDGDINRQRTIFTDVITCAAPNKGYAKYYCHVTDKENRKALNDRIRFILDIAKKHGIQLLFLGAYGAGAFGQDGEEVAQLFIYNIRKYYRYDFHKVIFAVTGDNYEKFRKVLFEKRETRTS